MAIVLNGTNAAGNIDLGTNGTITDLAVGGLPDGTVDGDTLASGTLKLVNYAQTFKKDTDSDSVAQGAVSDALISLSYAAASNSNKLLLSYTCHIGLSSSVNTYGYLYIGGSVSTYIGDQGESNQKRATSTALGSAAHKAHLHSAQILISSPSTSSTAYDFRLSQGNNGTETVYINRDSQNSNYDYYARFVSSITILELAP